MSASASGRSNSPQAPAIGPQARVRGKTTSLAEGALMLSVAPVTLSTDRLVLRPLSEGRYSGPGKRGHRWRPVGEGHDHSATIRRVFRLRGKSAEPPRTRSRLAFYDGGAGGRQSRGVDAVHEYRLPRIAGWRSARPGSAHPGRETFVNTHAEVPDAETCFRGPWAATRSNFGTHSRNSQSRAAIERLGAKLDGILRQHMVMPDGHIRDTAVYSITSDEWPGVRDRLDARLA